MQSVHINLPDSTPDGRRFWLDDSQFNIDVKGYPVPYFSLREASVTFFGRARPWLHYQVYNRGPWYLDGDEFEFTLDSYGRRILSLASIERLAHAMYQTDVIFDLLRLATVVNQIKYCGLAHGYLDIRGNRINGEDVKRAWKNTNRERHGDRHGK